MAGRTRTLHPTCRDDSPTQKLPSTRRHPGREQRHWSVRTPRAPPPRAPRCAGARCPPSPRATRPRRPLPGSRDPDGTPATPTSRRPRQPRRSRAPSRLWGARVGCGSRNSPHTCTAGAGRVTCGWNCGAGGPGMPCDCSSMVRGAGASALCRKGKVTVSKVIAAARADPPGAPGGPPGQPVPTPATAGPQRWSPN